MPPKFIRFFKYSIVGGGTFAFDLALLYVLTEFFAVQYVIAAGVAFLIAVSINYWFSRQYVFKRTLREVKEGYVHFVTIALIGLLMVMGGMFVLVEYAHFDYLFARIIVALVTGFWNYLMNLYVNFKVVDRH
ncbi:MAG: hypothetical protein RL097_264 [Candidatus Parcubacteria bacterium]|jgi:putative flippase GtrA